MKFSREWAMPSADTFSINPIGQFVKRHIKGVSVDPFARNNHWCTHYNDLDENTTAVHHLDARDFLNLLIDQGVRADTIIFDPPYSPRQVSECYNSIGLDVSNKDTQTARTARECRSLFRELAAPGAVCLSFGWNSTGMGKGWEIIEIMLVAHGGAHNDTICMAEIKTQDSFDI